MGGYIKASNENCENIIERINLSYGHEKSLNMEVSFTGTQLMFPMMNIILFRCVQIKMKL